MFRVTPTTQLYLSMHAVISQINLFSAQQPISGELFPDTQSTDSVQPSDAISKTTLPLPGVSSPIVPEHETSDTDAQPTQPMDSSMSDSEPTVDRGARQSRAGRRTNWKTRVFNLTAQKAKDMYGTEKVTESMLADEVLIRFKWMSGSYARSSISPSMQSSVSFRAVSS